MTKPHIRLLFRNDKGETVDAEHDFDLDDDFAGIMPVVGDRIFDKGVVGRLDRGDPRNRRVLTVVERVFNPRDNGYIGLVVKEAPVTKSDEWMVPGL